MPFYIVAGPAIPPKHRGAAAQLIVHDHPYPTRESAANATAALKQAPGKRMVVVEAPDRMAAAEAAALRLGLPPGPPEIVDAEP